MPKLKSSRKNSLNCSRPKKQIFSCSCHLSKLSHDNESDPKSQRAYKLERKSSPGGKNCQNSLNPLSFTTAETEKWKGQGVRGNGKLQRAWGGEQGSGRRGVGGVGSECGVSVGVIAVSGAEQIESAVWEAVWHGRGTDR